MDDSFELRASDARVALECGSKMRDNSCLVFISTRFGEGRVEQNSHSACLSRLSDI